MTPTIRIDQVDHIGIRVRDFDRAMTFYRALGFELLLKVPYDAVAIIKPSHRAMVTARSRAVRRVRSGWDTGR